MIEHIESFAKTLGIAPQLLWIVLGLVVGLSLRGRRGGPTQDTVISTVSAGSSRSAAPTTFNTISFRSSITIETPQGKQEISGDDCKEIFGLIQKDRRIEAIKLLREKTGAGLAESKSVVDVIERQLLS